MPKAWFAARTRPLAEYTASDRLQIAGFEVFLPCVRTVQPRRGRDETPLFPGYLFLRCDPEELGWGALERVPQIAGMVSFDGVVPPVPEEVIDGMVQWVEFINCNGGLWTPLYPGDRVCVTLGLLESFAEIVTRAKSPRGRVRVLIEFLGRLVYADVPWKDVHLASTPEDVRLAQESSDQCSFPQNELTGPTTQRRKRRSRRSRGKDRWVKGFGTRRNQG